MGQFLEIHTPVVLMATVAGFFALEAVMALHAGQGHLLGRDLVVDSPVHVRAHPFVFSTVRQSDGLHAGLEGLLPVQVLPVGGLVIRARGEEMRHQQIAVHGVRGLDSIHDLERIDPG